MQDLETMQREYMARPEATITIQHGSKYTRHWIGHVTRQDLGGYSMGKGSGDGVPQGCYRSRKAIDNGIRLEREYLEARGFKVRVIVPVQK